MTARKIIKQIAHNSKLIDICVLKGNRIDMVKYTTINEKLFEELRSQLKA